MARIEAQGDNMPGDHMPLKPRHKQKGLLKTNWVLLQPE